MFYLLVCVMELTNVFFILVMLKDWWFVVGYPPEWMNIWNYNTFCTYKWSLKVNAKCKIVTIWRVTQYTFCDLLESKTRTRIPLCTQVKYYECRHKWKRWVEGCILFTISSSIWSKLKSPRTNILVTFTKDRTFSTSCIKSVTKLWIVPGGR